MKFTKMHGLGNDYIYIDCFETQVEHPSELAKRMSDRHTGVGGDGLVLIMPSSHAAARMRMFNADGSEAEMCGNAIRCVAKYLYEHRLVAKERFTIETLAGNKEVILQVEASKVQTVTVDMGQPIFNSEEVPVSSGLPQTLNYPIEVNSKQYCFTAVSMGNPHCVIFVPEITDAMIYTVGPLIEKHPLFPRKTNVEFVIVQAADRLQMRVWERGTGETMACGTGACAVVAAAVANHLTERNVNVQLPGGVLKVFWDESSRHVWMTGPAVTVFQGEWPL